MPIHSCFINQIQHLTHQTDPYRHKEHLSKKCLKSHNRYLIYSKKSVFKIVLVVVVVVLVVVVVQAYLKNRVRYGDETLHRYWNP